MPAEKINKILFDQLFSDAEAKVFAILDGASIPDLLKQVYEKKPAYLCLYRGELEPDMAVVAPYVVELKPETPFTEWVLGEGWGKHWGIFAVSREDLKVMRRHLRSLLQVKDYTGRQLNFRYYDPRVLRAYLPTCNAEDLTQVFGPISFLALEGEDAGQLLKFSNGGEAAKVEQVSLAAKPNMI
ncbi:MAG: hypothetical protein JWQ71_140 [Pedosphaera sp.]|nr:hypothetical protein [Pedosphaera sp.]